MHGLFPTIEEITLDHVRSFLEEATEEGVTWEAKADDDEFRQRPEGEALGRLGKNTIRKAVCGLANQIGGYLILGARLDRSTSTWRLCGFHLEHPEPQLWISQVISSGVRPTPRCRFNTWRLEDHRVVAIIEVQPVAQAPCMTAQGHVYERVSGETRRVNDPARLAALFARGAAAQEQANQEASRAAADLCEALETGEGHGSVAIGIAPVSREDTDISARLFTETWQVAAGEALKRLQPRHMRPDLAYPSIGQAAVTSQAIVFAPLEPDQDFDTPDHEREVRSIWALVGRWDGSVAAGASFAHDVAGTVSLFDDFLGPAREEVAALVRQLGGHGPASLTIQIVGAGPPQDYGVVGGSVLMSLTHTLVARRQIALEGPEIGELGSIQREVLRATGKFSFEPE